jgi:hypothetical protein
MPEGAGIRIQGAVRLAVGVAGMLFSFVSGNSLGFAVEWDDATAGTDELLTGRPHEARLFALGKKVTSLATDDPTLEELGGASLQLGLGAGSAIWTGRQVLKEGAGSTTRSLTGPGLDQPLFSLQDITRSRGSTLFEELSVSPGAKGFTRRPAAFAAAGTVEVPHPTPLHFKDLGFREIDPITFKVYRGGPSLEVTAKDIRIEKATGLVQPTHGLSLDMDPEMVRKFGGAFRIKNMPQGLKIIQRGQRKTHYEIVPEHPMTFQEYTDLMKRVELVDE